MKKTSTILALTLCMACNATMHAQFGLKKLVPGKSAAPASDSPKTAINNDELLRTVTFASDQGMLAMDELASAFPEDKIAAFKDISDKYHAAQAKRTDGNVDANQMQLCSDAMQELVKMKDSWKEYKKEKRDAVRKADAQLGLMLVLDTAAATKVPSAIQDLQASVSSLASNPMQILKIRKIKKQIQLFTMVGKQIPVQTSAISNVRTITKNIARAEKMTLKPDPTPQQIQDPALMGGGTTKAAD